MTKLVELDGYKRAPFLRRKSVGIWSPQEHHLLIANQTRITAEPLTGATHRPVELVLTPHREDRMLTCSNTSQQLVLRPYITGKVFELLTRRIRELVLTPYQGGQVVSSNTSSGGLEFCTNTSTYGQVFSFRDLRPGNQPDHQQDQEITRTQPNSILSQLSITLVDTNTLPASLDVTKDPDSVEILEFVNLPPTPQT